MANQLRSPPRSSLRSPLEHRRGGAAPTAFSALAQAATRRVDLMMIGDSNQTKDGYGFIGGFLNALSTRYGEYATGVVTGQVTPEIAYTTGVESGAPAGIEALWPTNSPRLYGYVPDGSTSTDATSGVRVDATSNLGNTNALRFHYGYATFDYGAGSFKVGARLGVSPYSTLADGPLISTNTGEFSLQIGTLDIPGDIARVQSIEAKMHRPGSNVITGPFLQTFGRLENVSKDNGLSVSTLYGVGGASMYDMALALIGWSDLALTNYFTEVRRLQLSKALTPIVVVYINSGLNDRNETSAPSLGPNPASPGDSAAAYADNLNAVVDRIESVWSGNGWALSELSFLVVPSHPVSDPDGADLIEYRSAAKTFSNRPRFTFVDFNELITATTMLSNGWYLEGGADRSHLTSPAGYDGMAQLVVDTIP